MAQLFVHLLQGQTFEDMKANTNSIKSLLNQKLFCGYEKNSIG